jgi:hypothetical protein
MSTHRLNELTIGPPVRRSVRRRSTRLGALIAEERGQALPEFALVLPILLLVVFGIVQFALALNSKNNETHVANELARYAIINENPGGAEDPRAWAKKHADAANLEICISFPEGEAAGKPVKVEAKRAFKWLPVLKLKPATITLTGTAYMRLETAPAGYWKGCTA